MIDAWLSLELPAAPKYRLLASSEQTSEALFVSGWGGRSALPLRRARSRCKTRLVKAFAGNWPVVLPRAAALIRTCPWKTADPGAWSVGFGEA